MTFRQHLVAQFMRPSGVLGRMAGYVMAHRASNIGRNTWTLELLSIQAEDRVLEIGFGPGIALRQAAARANMSIIVGIDHSEVMCEQASHRNARSIEAGYMQLYQGTIADLPDFSRGFNKIYSANVVQFWSDPVVEFTSIRKLMAPEGLIATTFMPRNARPTKADVQRMADKIVQALEESGFTGIKPVTKTFGSIDAVCVLARKCTDLGFSS